MLYFGTTIWFFFSACFPEFDGSIGSNLIDNPFEDNDDDNFTEEQDDCDDRRSDVYPGAPELCDGIDNDCNGQIDENPSNSVWYQDLDQDGFGVEGYVAYDCDRPAGYVPFSGDCDDSNPSINPNGVEVCDNVDNDCDGDVDDEDLTVLAITGTEFFRDQDNDLFGTTADSIWACDAPEGYRENSGDCNDDDASIFPTAAEIVSDGIDQNCDGFEECYTDADNDGFGGINTQLTTNILCTQGGVSINSTDCDDTNYAIKSSENDADCDGTLSADDCNDSDAMMPSQDADCDGALTVDDCDDFDSASTVVATDADCDGVLTGDDCDDSAASLGDQSLDGDCDGAVTAEDCDDSDPASTVIATDADCDGTATADDCDDADSTSTIVATDGDCDGVLTADDCDDFNPNSTVTATDADCDGTVTADDCNDFNPASTTIFTDADCDGIIAIYDCDDADPTSYTLYIDSDCDGVIASADCNDSDPALLSHHDDGDCDGALTADDCDDADPGSTVVATDGDCDGASTGLDCDDADPSDVALAGDCDQDTVDISIDCDDTDATLLSSLRDLNCDGYLDVEVITTSASNSCALGPDDDILCWGDDSFGQSSPPMGVFQQVSLGGCFVQNAAGGCDTSVGLRSDQHGCAIDDGNDLECWGSDYFGQANPPFGNFTKVSAGGVHTCAINSSTAEVECWGDDHHGQSSPPAGTFTTVVSGADHTCALDTSGTVECWGNATVAAGVPQSSSYVSLSAGDGFSCALDSSGAIECWGDNSNNQLNAPTGSFAVIESGGGHSCAIDLQGDAVCWGLDDVGQSTASNASNSGFAQVSAGGQHSCGLTDNQQVVCWGSDTEEQSSHPHCDGDVSALLIADDQDCDGLPTAQDCNDLDPTSLSIASDADCDGSATIDDCNDSDADEYPGAVEIADGQDNDCDGAIPTDEMDSDGDGWIEATYDSSIWDTDSTVVQGGLDCNDSDATVYPLAPELCDGQINDCSNGVLSSAEIDDDGDGYVDCTIDSGGWDGTVSMVGGDCDDSSAYTYPGAEEICDSVYNDCDHINYGVGTPPEETDDDLDDAVECELHASWSGAVLMSGGDCDDSDPTVNPTYAGYLEATPGCYRDVDGDGYGDDSAGAPIDAGTDCDDSDVDTLYDMDCDGTRNDLDSLEADCDDSDPALNRNDLDGDTFTSCEQDCDDSDPNVYYVGYEYDFVAYESVYFDCVEDADGDFHGAANPSNPNASSGDDCDDDVFNVLSADQDGDCDGLSDYSMIAVSPDHHCVLNVNDNTVWCEMNDSSGSSGSEVLSGYNWGMGLNIEGIAVARNATCVWGSSLLECHGSEYDSGMMAPPVSSNVEKVALAESHGCALYSSGAVSCWGYDYFGETSAPVSAFLDIAVEDWNSSCGILRTDGSIQCWGDTTSLTADPANIPTGSFQQIVSGYGHYCALADDYSVSCWGYDSHLQTEPPAGQFVRLAAGGQSTCGISTTGYPYCWGYGHSMPDNTGNTYTPPSTYAADIAVYDEKGCMIEPYGYTSCWGMSSSSASSWEETY